MQAEVSITQKGAYASKAGGPAQYERVDFYEVGLAIRASPARTANGARAVSSRLGSTFWTPVPKEERIEERGDALMIANMVSRVARGRVTSLAAVLVAALLLAGAAPAGAQYFGSEFCFDCHSDYYNDWKVSGHPYKLMQAPEAQIRPIPLPEGYSWDDISYVIGGYKWKSRYLGLDGFIITAGGNNQYNMMTGRWVDYHKDEVKPYDCGRCHTTGFTEGGNQDGLPGIEGTWEFGGIHCEECHGPFTSFAQHFGPGPIVDTSSAACGECHIRGDANTIPARGGFIRHHEQYNEQLASPHRNLDCVSCHNPHKKSEFSIRATCSDCHDDYAEAYEGTPMEIAGVLCEDCHMPFASKSAEVLGPFMGDVRTHLFRINTDRDGQMFTDDGNFVLLDGDGQGAVTLDFACQGCHRDKSFGWIAGQAKKFHLRR